MKQFIYKIWNWLVVLLNKVRRDRLYHFIAGMIAAAFCLIVLKMYVCIWPVVILAFVKEFIDRWQDGNFDWIDLLATVLGGLVVQVLVFVAIRYGQQVIFV
ncbi:MAG: hypothetical protein J6P46_06445 [Bacteroidales bacterium]|nr:hypothetical protein [Bacteroidales bacterium]